MNTYINWTGPIPTIQIGCINIYLPNDTSIVYVDKNYCEVEASDTDVIYVDELYYQHEQNGIRVIAHENGVITKLLVNANFVAYEV